MPNHHVDSKVWLRDAHRRREELANSLTHAVGVAGSLAAAVLLVGTAMGDGDWFRIVSALVYGASLLAMYTASTLYHGLSHSKRKRVLRVIDHCAIYVLIAGTYTPFMLITLREGSGWLLLGAIWMLTAGGIVFKVSDIDRFPVLSTGIYLFMGWLGLLVIEPLIRLLPAGGLAWLIGGGVAYSLGTVFYHADRLPYGHAVWHVFVLAGSACHFMAVFYYVLAPGPLSLP